MAPSYEVNPHNQDHYSAYNKPLAIIDWLEKDPPEEEWLVIIDADMILREPFVCAGAGGSEAEALPPILRSLPCKRSRPIAAFYGYLVGSTNDLGKKHLPEVQPRNNTSGGQPYGRRADQVGGLFIVHRDDMKQYMHDWLKITEQVRFDPDVRCWSRL
jgi:peptidyl serine alpha-galactosyltransferase